MYIPNNRNIKLIACARVASPHYPTDLNQCGIETLIETDVFHFFLSECGTRNSCCPSIWIFIDTVFGSQIAGESRVVSSKRKRRWTMAYHSSADRYSAVCFDVRDDADKGNSAKLKFEGSRALTKAINF